MIPKHSLILLVTDKLIMLMILTITLLSISEATGVLCTKNASTFTVELRDEIVDALKNETNTNGTQRADIESKCTVSSVKVPWGLSREKWTPLI